MNYVIGGLMAFAFLCVWAFTYSDGLWSTTVLFFNVLFAMLLAFNVYEPLCDYLDQAIGQQWAMLMDYAVLWLLFGVHLFILRTITDRLSRVKVRFLHTAEVAGSVGVALLLGAVCFSFLSFSLYAAPLGKDSFPKPKVPEKMMYYFFEHESKWGGMSSFLSDHKLDANTRDDKDYFERYDARRLAYEEEDGVRVP